MVASTAASTDSPVMRHISATYTAMPTMRARTAAAAIATSGWPPNSDAVAYRP